MYICILRPRLFWQYATCFLSKTQKTIFQKMKLGCYKITLHKWAFALISKTLVYKYAMFQNGASNYMQWNYFQNKN